MSIDYTVREIGEVTILDLSGRITQGEALGLSPGTGVALEELVLDQVARGHRKILLNLREVSYIDSSGLGQLFACSTALRQAGGQMRICNASLRALDLLRITHLASILDPDKDEATALQAFTSDQRPLAIAASDTHVFTGSGDTRAT